MKRAIPLLCLLAQARGEDAPPSTLSTAKGPPRHTPVHAKRGVTTTTTYVIVHATPSPPLAQSGDLSSYGNGQSSEVTINAASAAEVSSTPTDTATLPPSTTPTFPMPLSSLVSLTPSVTSIFTVQPVPIISAWSRTTTNEDVTALTVASTLSSDTVTQIDQDSLEPTAPLTSAADETASATTTSSSDEGPFRVPGLFLGNEELPTTVPVAAASSAMSRCADLYGGIRPDGAIGKGCGSFFVHIMDCFSSNGPWTTPYDEARDAAYRTCVCMSSDDNPFTEYSALFKNFTGCAACVERNLGPDVEPWVTLEARRMFSYCRAQEPNGFLFTLFLRNWYFRLGDYADTAVKPFEAAFGPGADAGMEAMRAQYTGRPPLANAAWGPSALPDGKLAGVSPSVSLYTTEASVADVRITTLASTFVTWIPTKPGETFDINAAAATESKAADALVESALCLNRSQDRQPCNINKASREAVVWPEAWVWALSVAVAVVVGGAALCM